MNDAIRIEISISAKTTNEAKSDLLKFIDYYTFLISKNAEAFI